MFRIPFLRNLLLLVLVLLAGLPLYALLVLHPAYHQQLIQATEDEATRFATYLLRDLQLEGVRLERDRLPAATMDQVAMIKDDRSLIKLRFFSPDGEIVFSTETGEVGKANTSESFRNVVAKGRVFSQVVKKHHLTADGVATELDIVETYVPFLADRRFAGAIEVYYDITGRVAGIDALTLRTTLLLLLVSAGFLTAMLLALNKARVSLGERDRAESALRQVNAELEERVATRTAELSMANTQLTAEIAERTLARMALSQALEDSRHDREKLDGILRSVGDGLIVTDHCLVVLHMNAAAEKLLELPLETALGQPLGRLAAGANLSHLVRNLPAAGSNPATFDFELPGEDPRRPRVYQVRVSPLESDQGQAGLVLLLHDVTRERELDRMKNAFLGMAAHELNTPLASILGFSELLTSADSAARLTPQQREEYLQLIHGKGLDLSRLVDDLLDISRVEAGQSLALDCQAMRLDDLVREVLQHYQGKNPRHRFELHCVTAQTAIQADPVRIRQVLNNLVSNAVKYSPQGGVIKVVVADGRAGRCRFSVIDEGIGMTAEQVEHSFDSFYRADSSNTAVQGAGLGMSIVRHIVQAHRGEIWLESQLGLGTSVHVELPLRSPPCSQADRAD
jgi:signal transduction histidine kinase